MPAPLPHSPWRLGLSRTDISAYEPGQLLFGWGDDRGRAAGVAERLHARALVVRGPAGAVAVACLDLCFISTVLREAILDALAARWPEVDLPRAAVMLTATHTHSGPAGLSDSPLYEMMNYGFSPGVFAHVVERTAEALALAWNRAVPGRVRLGRAVLPRDAPVAFNRSLEAHRQNVEVDADVAAEDAADRTLTALSIEDLEGRALGMVCWFASHGTAIHAGQALLHSDHKGLAACAMEARKRLDNSDYVAIFAQGAAGDITPNHRWSAERGRRVGLADCDVTSARTLAGLQVDAAERALQDAAASDPLEGPVFGRMRVADLADTAVSPRFTRGAGPAHTRPACLGTGFLTGTEEGPGPLGGLCRAVRGLGRARMQRHHRSRWRLSRARRAQADPMVPFGELGQGVRGRVLGIPLHRSLATLARLDPCFAWLHGVQDSLGTLDRPWLSGRMHAQLLHIGPFTLVGVPGEPTTIAGRRIADTVARGLGSDGPVQVCGYANGYAGYITTHEEYSLQTYEGGSTAFGPWTLAGWRTSFDQLARQEGDPRFVPGPPLEIVDVATLTEERIQGRARMGRFARRVSPQRSGAVLGRR